MDAGRAGMRPDYGCRPWTIPVCSLHAHPYTPLLFVLNTLLFLLTPLLFVLNPLLFPSTPLLFVLNTLLLCRVRFYSC